MAKHLRHASAFRAVANQDMRICGETCTGGGTTCDVSQYFPAFFSAAPDSSLLSSDVLAVPCCLPRACVWHLPLCQCDYILQ